LAIETVLFVVVLFVVVLFVVVLFVVVDVIGRIRELRSCIQFAGIPHIFEG